MRYPRGKSWNWYLRAVKRGDWHGSFWVEQRKAKALLRRDIGSLFITEYLSDFEGLAAVVDDSTEILEVQE